MLNTPRVDSPHAGRFAAVTARLAPLPYIFLPLISGALLALCFPYTSYTWLVWIALVPLFLALQIAPRPRTGAGMGLLFGVAFFGALHRYLLQYGILPTFLVGLLEALPLAIFGGLGVHLLRRPSALVGSFALAGAWALQEALRANCGPLSLTFGQIGYTQHSTLPLLQAASYAGALGLGFLIALVNAALARLIAGGERSELALALSLVIVAAVAVHGELVLKAPAPAGPALSVGVVQPNPDLHSPLTEADLQVCRVAYTQFTDLLMSGLSASLTEPGRFERPELVVWPETALPVAINLAPEYMNAVVTTAALDHVNLILGALEEQGDQIRNNAWLFDAGGVLRGKYSKNDLVMFGEYVPGRNTIPLLKRYPIRDFDFTPGRGRNLLAVQGHPCGALICFEAIFPGPARDEVRRGAQFLVFLTSDAWAGPSSEVLLHAETAPLRAVEIGRWVVRAASIGPSEILSPRGEVLAQVAALQSGVAHASITPMQDLTPYVRYGDAPLLIFAALLVALGLMGRREHPTPTPPLI